MSKIVTDFQKKVLKALADRMDDFYLVGGTALALYYFNHRQSQDLDFFMQEFSKKSIEDVVRYLSGALKKKISLKNQQLGEKFAKIAVYSIPINKEYSLKVDFVEDYVGLIMPPKYINGIKVASLEDIYIKKIYTIAGTHEIEDSIGRKKSMGNRQSAKDFFDL